MEAAYHYLLFCENEMLISSSCVHNIILLAGKENVQLQTAEMVQQCVTLTQPWPNLDPTLTQPWPGPAVGGTCAMPYAASRGAVGGFERL